MWCQFKVFKSKFTYILLIQKMISTGLGFCETDYVSVSFVVSRESTGLSLIRNKWIFDFLKCDS